MRFYSLPGHGGIPQRGVVTLLTTMVLLFCITVITLYSTRVAVTEQRLAANDLRAQQALSAAQAGLEAALATLPATALDGVTFDAAGRARLDGPAATLPDGTTFTTRFSTLDRTPHGTGLLRIRALGVSVDGSSRRTVHRTVAFTPWMVRTPGTALVTRNGGRTLSGDAYFADFFGRPREVVRNNAVAIRCRRCPGARLDGAGRLLWADAQRLTLTGGHIGRPGRPVILIVEGDLAVTADTSLTGLIYVTGIVRTGSERLTVRGAVVLEGQAGDTPAVTYDLPVLERLRRLGRYARVAGSWRDF